MIDEVSVRFLSAGTNLRQPFIAQGFLRFLRHRLPCRLLIESRQMPDHIVNHLMGEPLEIQPIIRVESAFFSYSHIANHVPASISMPALYLAALFETI